MEQCNDCTWCVDVCLHENKKLYCYNHRCVVFLDGSVCDKFEEREEVFTWEDLENDV